MSQTTISVLAAFFGVILGVPASMLAARYYPQMKRNKGLGIFLSVFFIVSLLSFLGLTYFLNRGNGNSTYRVRVTVIDPQNVPVVTPEGRPPDDVRVWADVEAAAQPAPGGWQFNISPSIRPLDGKLTLRAEKKDAYWIGQTEIVLKDDYNPKATIQLKHNKSARVLGVVRDKKGNPIAEAEVWVGGHSEILTTNAGGNFNLAAHAAVGQKVHIYAKKGRQKGDVSTAIAGDVQNEITIK